MEGKLEATAARLEGHIEDLKARCPQ